MIGMFIPSLVAILFHTEILFFCIMSMFLAVSRLILMRCAQKSGFVKKEKLRIQLLSKLRGLDDLRAPLNKPYKSNVPGGLTNNSSSWMRLIS